MSVKERIEQIVNNPGAEAVGLVETEEKRKKELNIQFEREISEARYQQAMLLEDLRRLKIVAMIEEIVEKDGESEMLKEWNAQILPPTLSNEGVWDTTLRIVIIKDPNLFYAIPEEKKGSYPRVTVAYGRDRYLTISGQETTFYGLMPDGNLEQTKIETIEHSLAMACVQPKRPSSH